MSTPGKGLNPNASAFTFNPGASAFVPSGECASLPCVHSVSVFCSAFLLDQKRIIVTLLELKEFLVT